MVTLLGGLFVPDRGSREVDLDAVTIGIKDAEAELGGSAALLRGELIPTPGFLIVLSAADAARVDQPGIGLRVDDSLLGRCPAPAQRLDGVLRHIEAVREQKVPIAFGGRAVALGSSLVPPRETRPPIDAITVQMQKAQLMLSLGVTLRCRPLIAGGSIGEIGQDSVTTGIEQSQAVGRFGISERCRRSPFLECRGVIGTLIRVTSARYFGCGLPGPIFQKPDHGSRMASWTPRITPLNMYIETERDPTLMSAARVMSGTSRKLSGTPCSVRSPSAIRAL